MGSILKVTTDGFDTSPIRRGAWVSKNFVGNVYSPPPENIKPIQSDTSGAHTIRERIEQHKQHESCAACHRQIDPYGFALESFDATGQWRSRYREMLPHQGTFQYRRQGYFRPADAVDPSGEIAEQQFDDIKAFKRILLANQRKIAYNFMKKFFTYVNGHAPSLAQRLKLHGKVPANPATIGMRDLVETVLLMSTGADE